MRVLVVLFVATMMAGGSHGFLAKKIFLSQAAAAKAGLIEDLKSAVADFKTGALLKKNAVVDGLKAVGGAKLKVITGVKEAKINVLKSIAAAKLAKIASLKAAKLTFAKSLLAAKLAPLEAKKSFLENKVHLFEKFTGSHVPSKLDFLKEGHGQLANFFGSVHDFSDKFDPKKIVEKLGLGFPQLFPAPGKPTVKIETYKSGDVPFVGGFYPPEVQKPAPVYGPPSTAYGVPEYRSNNS
ncbi:uncharacterized protein LOC111674197 [Orussus abietinus]|uniref:uncharacterized protein LOC111674197 n=1 Tax=Orussus abietinus TaxID=222816 RepID=UPI000C716352|nr:uncharacterized protein LOC111674197 [Orussus abietinus]